MNALLIKLLNMSAAGSVLILAVVVLRALLRKAPRWIICMMWALVAIRLICPISIASPVSAFRATPSIVSESGEVEVFRPAGGSEKPLLAVDTVQIERPQASSETIRDIPGTSYAVTQRSRDAYLPPLVQAYLLGLTVMLLYAVISTLLLRRKVSVSLQQRGNVRICDEVASPFILGIFWPAIYLPSSLSEEEKRFVLAHERAHLRRLDHIWKPLGFLILSVHWFNPFCWLAYVLLCRDIELACDEKVIRELGRAERAAYSQTLLNCSAHRMLAACPVAFGETDVKTRVKAVLNYKKPAFWVILAAVLACIVLIVCFATNPIQEQDLSFLNYKNAIPLIGQNDTAPYANLHPADSDGVQPGVADAKALAQFLESAKWTKRRAPSSSPEPRGYLEFMIEDDYRIIVYQSERLAAVRFGNEIRYYRTGAGDYEAALATFTPAPSTAPDRVPEQTVSPTAAGWTLQCRVQSNQLAELPIPAELSAALEEKLAQQIPLNGMEASFVEGWGMRYPAGADLLPVFLTAPGENTNLTKCIQRNAEGRYGRGGVEAHEEICAILDWLADQTGWQVHADPSDFRSLSVIALMKGDEVLLRIEQPARLAAFETLMQGGMYTVGDASKTPMESIELRAIRSDGMVLELLLDPEGPFVWLPPFGYYRYNAPESTGVKPVLDALGLEDWPEELKTVDYAAMRETYERLQPISFIGATEPLHEAEQTAQPSQEATPGVVSSTPHELTAEEEELIVYMLSEIAGKTEPYVLSDYTKGQMDDVPDLCWLVEVYARTHRLSVDELRGLMLGTQKLDGAYAEGYAALLAELHTLDPLRFAVAYSKVSDPPSPALLYELYAPVPLDHIYPPEELAREYADFCAIYDGMTAYLLSEYGLNYAHYAASPGDMAYGRCGFMTVEPVDWFFKGVIPEWAVQVVLDHAGNAKMAVGVLTVYFGRPDGSNDMIPVGAYLKIGENVSHVETHEVKSDLYTPEDIRAAIELIKGEFQESYNGCTLTEICYAGDEFSSRYQDWADRAGADEVIVLLSSFDVDASGGDGSLNPNSTYERWNWILVRTDGGPWRLVDHGY